MTYDPVNNLPENVVAMNPGLHEVQTFFMPSNVAHLENGDFDFSGGGITVLPKQKGAAHIAVAAGKFGTTYLLNLSNIGGFLPGGPKDAGLVADRRAAIASPPMLSAATGSAGS